MAKSECSGSVRVGAVLGYLAVLVSLLLLCIPPVSAMGLTQQNLISDIPGLALHTDANVVNSWGIAFGPTGLLWVADNGAGVATVHKPDGQPTGLVVTIPVPPGDVNPATPTGIVFNSTSDFKVTEGEITRPSRFLFATEDGTISGWNPEVDLTHAILAADNSASGAVYKGIAIASNNEHNFIYATNFFAGVVDVFDENFNFVGSFTDPDIPAGFAPFGIRNIGNRLFVTYAKQLAPDNEDDEAGPGNGFVVIFTPSGQVVKELVKQGRLNSPWGLEIAPPGFGRLSGQLLVGNFGDGRINAYDPRTGTFAGTVLNRQGRPLEIEGLWGLQVRQNVEDNGNHKARGIPLLYFAAGINDEADGLVGTLRLPVARGVFR